MVIVSAKVSKRKVLLGLLAAVCVILLLAFFLGDSDAPTEQPALDAQPQQSLDAGSNEERLAFLRSFGWEVSQDPTQTQEVRIPQNFNDVFTRYNQMQQEQGFDLSAYAGKIAKRYVYKITNDTGGSQDHYATLLVYRNKIIGGDVTSTAQGGAMHGFTMPG